MIFKQTGNVIMRNLPTIITIAGSVGVIAGGVVACRATLKADRVIEQHNTNIEVVKESGFSDIRLYRKMIFKTYLETGIKFARLYGPAIIITSFSLGGILYGHNVLRTRNLALAGAYKALTTNYEGFRNRVQDQYGEDNRIALENDFKVEEITEKDEDGKDIKKNIVVMPEPEVLGNEHAKFFCESSIYWTKDPEKNLRFLRNVEERMQEKFDKQGYLFLNDVYDQLDIPRTYGGSVCGWIKGLGDNRIDFGIYDIFRESSRRFVNGYEPVILLDFNHDGYIADKI